MKVLVLEEHDRVSKIYQRILNEKGIEANLIKNDSEFEKTVNKNYDLEIISSVLPQTTSILNKIAIKSPQQRVVYLSSYCKEDENLSNLVGKTREIIQKPFAFLTLLAEEENKLILQ